MLSALQVAAKEVIVEVVAVVVVHFKYLLKVPT